MIIELGEKSAWAVAKLKRFDWSCNAKLQIEITSKYILLGYTAGRSYDLDGYTFETEWVIWGKVDVTIKNIDD